MSRVTMRRALSVVAAFASLSGCGGGDEVTEPAPVDQSTVNQPDPGAASDQTLASSTVPAEDDSAATQPPATPPPAPAATEPPAGEATTTCPDAATLATAYGGEVALDEAAAMTGAVGLVFCPYNQVLAPGATHPVWGYEAIPDTFSITYTNQNIVAGADGEPVTVAGTEAFWGGSELSVWTGEQGLIVSMIDPPGDPLATAIALAEAALQ